MLISSPTFSIVTVVVISLLLLSATDPNIFVDVEVKFVAALKAIL